MTGPDPAAGPLLGEARAVRGQDAPHTRASLAADLRRLGLAPGATVLVHSSLSAMGWVSGGALAVVQAVLDVLGPAGTLVVPSQSGELSDPAGWSNPPVPRSWWQPIRDSMPAYDPALTPTRGMGAVAEVVRHLPAAIRSAHPALSFTAAGPAAPHLMAPHTLDAGLGEQSPLGRLATCVAWTLLLGVGWDCATCLHLAEHRTGGRNVVRAGAPLMVDGNRRWVEFDSLDYDTEHFAAAGAAFEATGAVTVGRVGSGTARLCSVVDAVDFVGGYLVTPGDGLPTGGTGADGVGLTAAPTGDRRDHRGA